MRRFHVHWDGSVPAARLLTRSFRSSLPFKERLNAWASVLQVLADGGYCSEGRRVSLLEGLFKDPRRHVALFDGETRSFVLKIPSGVIATVTFLGRETFRVDVDFNRESRKLALLLTVQLRAPQIVRSALDPRRTLSPQPCALCPTLLWE